MADSHETELSGLPPRAPPPADPEVDRRLTLAQVESAQEALSGMFLAPPVWEQTNEVASSTSRPATGSPSPQEDEHSLHGSEAAAAERETLSMLRSVQARLDKSIVRSTSWDHLDPATRRDTTAALREAQGHLDHLFAEPQAGGDPAETPNARRVVGCGFFRCDPALAAAAERAADDYRFHHGSSSMENAIKQMAEDFAGAGPGSPSAPGRT